MKKARIVLITGVVVAMLMFPIAGDSMGISPTARGYGQMTYDSESEQVVLYGGQTGYWQDPTQQSHETWIFEPESNVWTQMKPSDTPRGCCGGDMTYNSRADRSILSVLSDDWSTLETWAYDANSDTWEQLADGPWRMVGQRIVYDSESDRIIMFGGFTLTSFKFVDETWAYDYHTNTWTNMQPRIHPSGRNYVGMVYDSKADRVVLWGDWQRNYTAATDESVWTYDFNTNTWQEFQHKKDGPAVRDYITLAYDEKADKIVMYGGYDYGNDETWIYDLNSDTWQPIQLSNNPGPLSRYMMVYVRDINRTVLFGGQDGPNHFQYKADTWLYNLRQNKWVNASRDD
jgi:Galactose oxidase, central domain